MPLTRHIPRTASPTTPSTDRRGAERRIVKGAGLARGPALIVGTVLSVCGLALFFKVAGTPLSTAGFSGADVQGQRVLGFEANAWTAWFTTAAGVLVLFGAAQHLLAKVISLVVGLALALAVVMAVIDGNDVLGLAAVNGLTALAWLVAALLLLANVLMPRRHHELVEPVPAGTTSHDARVVHEDDRTTGEDRTAHAGITGEPARDDDRGAAAAPPVSDHDPDDPDDAHEQPTRVQPAAPTPPEAQSQQASYGAPVAGGDPSEPPRQQS